MAKYLTLAKYSAPAMAAIRDAGYASRRAQMDVAMADVGATLEVVYFMNSTTWDFLMIFEADGDAPFLLGGVGTASGAFDRTETYELRSAEELDRVMNAVITWTPPHS
jgi:uncharacterized protein with GYD domain